MSFQVAQRQRAKLRLGISGVAGSGKTMGALLLAYGITGDWCETNSCVVGVINFHNCTLAIGCSRFRL